MIWRHTITYAEPSAPAVSFLATNPEARELIERAYPVLQSLFGDDIELELEAGKKFYNDPGNLWVNVLWYSSIERGLCLMERFYHEWYFERELDNLIFDVRCL